MNNTKFPEKLEAAGQMVCAKTAGCPIIATTDDPGVAAELVRRWNAHEALLDALNSVISDLEYGTVGRWKGAGSASLRSALKQAESPQ